MARYKPCPNYCPTPIQCYSMKLCHRGQALGENSGVEIASEWDHRGLSLANLVATWSKDPSTKVGAAIFRSDKTVASIGYNGFPRGIADDNRLHDRAVKYELIVHAEENAIFNGRENLTGFTLYSTLFPCTRCATSIIQSGIKRVCSPVPTNPRWLDSNIAASNLLIEAGVAVCLIDPK